MLHLPAHGRVLAPRLPGVLAVAVRYASAQVTVDYDPRTASEVQIRRRLAELGVSVRTEAAGAAISRRPQIVLAVLTGMAFLALGVGLGLEHLVGAPTLATGAYAAAYLAGGWRATRTDIAAIRGGILDINVLMLASAGGAATIGYW